MTAARMLMAPRRSAGVKVMWSKAMESRMEERGSAEPRMLVSAGWMYWRLPR